MWLCDLRIALFLRINMLTTTINIVVITVNAAAGAAGGDSGGECKKPALTCGTPGAVSPCGT